MDMQPEKKIDGRSLRAQRTYDEVHTKLVSTATEMYNNPLIENNKITVSSIAVSYTHLTLPTNREV